MLAALLTAATSHAQPRLEVVAGDTLNWGDVAPGVVQRPVKIINTGTTLLHISRVQPSCGCTLAPLDKVDIVPGDTATLSVSIDLAGASGPQAKSVTLHSNDSMRSQATVTIKARVVRDVLSNPWTFQYGRNLKVGVPATATVELMNESQSDVELREVVVQDTAGLLVEIEPLAQRVLKPRDTVRLSARVTPLKEGLGLGKVLVRTSSANMPEILLPLHCIVRTSAPSAEAQPSQPMEKGKH